MSRFHQSTYRTSRARFCWRWLKTCYEQGTEYTFWDDDGQEVTGVPVEMEIRRRWLKWHITAELKLKEALL